MNRTWPVLNRYENITVNTIFCLGSNYADHIVEMKDTKPSRPVVFLKPITALLSDQGTVLLPPVSTDVQHEVELVVVIGKSGTRIPADRAMDHIYGYALGLDITLRDMQAEAKEKGWPWTLAKGFDTAAPLSPVIPADQVADPGRLDLRLWVNDELRQEGNTGQMLMKIPAIIEYLSENFSLNPGDLIFTGTPAGVAPVRSGDRIRAGLGDLVELQVTAQAG